MTNYLGTDGGGTLGGFPIASNQGPGITLNVTGVTATGSAGLLTASVNALPIGVSATGSAGTVFDQVTLTLLGNSATGAAGALNDQISLTLASAVTTGSGGTLHDQITLTLSAASATGAAGALNDQISLTLANATGTGSGGIISVYETVATTGSSGTGQAGAFAVQITDTITGTSASGQAGILSITTQAGGVATGASSTGQAGTEITHITVMLAGVSATGQANAIGQQIGGQSIGVVSSGQAGLETDLVVATPVATVLAGQAGSLGPQIPGITTGVSGTSQLGILTTQIAANPNAIAGVSSAAPLTISTISGALPDLQITGVASNLTSDFPVLVLGVSATRGIGVFSFIIQVMNMAGASATGQAGAFARASGGKLTGASGISAAGVISPRVTGALTGAQATSGAGFITFPVPIFGVAGSSAVGTLNVSIAAPILGLSAFGIADELITGTPPVFAQGYAGTLTAVPAAPIDGNVVQGLAGSVTVSTLLNALLGVQGTTLAGTLSAQYSSAVLIAGVMAAGSASALSSEFMLPVSATGYAGTPLAQPFRFLFADSFDYYATLSDFVSNYIAASGQTLSASTAYNVGQAVSGALTLNGQWGGSNESRVYCSVLLKYGATAGTAADTVAITLQDNGSNQVSVVWAADGSITVRTGGTNGTILQTIRNAFRLNVWDSWQVGWIIGTSGSAEVRKNGALSGTIVTGNTRGGSGNSYVNQFLITSTSANWQIDDLLFSVGWPGDVRAVQQLPTGDVSVTFTSTGGNNFGALLTEDGDTSYVQATAFGQEDLYTLEPLSVAPTEIMGVQCYLAERNVTSGNGAGTLQVKSGATEITAASFAPQTGYRYATAFIPNDPNTGRLWTAASVNAMQIGVRQILSENASLRGVAATGTAGVSLPTIT
jgi:hypothetical protein